jgi:hypothetical protein
LVYKQKETNKQKQNRAQNKTTTMRRFRLQVVPLCKLLMYLTIGLAVCEMIIVNLTILYVYRSFSSQLSFLSSELQSDGPILDKILKVPALKNLVYAGKTGGFTSLIQNTVERIMIVTDNSKNNSNKSSSGKRLNG